MMTSIERRKVGVDSTHHIARRNSTLRLSLSLPPSLYSSLSYTYALDYSHTTTRVLSPSSLSHSLSHTHCYTFYHCLSLTVSYSHSLPNCFGGVTQRHTDRITHTNTFNNNRRLFSHIVQIKTNNQK
jgi:hypothetical protein